MLNQIQNFQLIPQPGNQISDLEKQIPPGYDQNMQQEENLIYKPYEIIYTLKQATYCFAMAINQEQTIMIAGSWNNIIVFEFNQGLYKKQLLSKHKNNYEISALCFMKKQNQFISGTNEIGIWGYDNTQYECLQIIQAHQGSVYKLLINKNEDLIISCSSDRTIKFWIRRSEWQLQQTLAYKELSNQVYDMSLNEAGTELVSCDRQGGILIIQQGDDGKWRKIQRILSHFGYRISLINDNLIAFQPENGKMIEIFQRNKLQNRFEKYKNVPVQNDTCCFTRFPMQFNQKKQLLMNKNGYRVNFIRYQDNDFIIEQSINFGTEYLWGAITDDFQYLVTWDDHSKEFQVRKQT